MDIDTSWIATLQDGDKVILAQDGLNRSRRVATVRLTVTQIVVVGTRRRFDRTTGKIKGGWSYESPYLLPYTPEAALRVKLTQALRNTRGALHTLNPDALDPDQAGALAAALTEVLRVLKTRSEHT